MGPKTETGFSSTLATSRTIGHKPAMDTVGTIAYPSHNAGRSGELTMTDPIAEKHEAALADCRKALAALDRSIEDCNNVRRQTWLAGAGESTITSRLGEIQQ